MATIVGLTAEATEELTDSAKARSNHTGTQAASTIIDFTEVAQDLMASTLVAGANVTLTYNDGAGTLTVAATGGGGGIIEGLALSTYTLGAGSAAANTTAIQTAVNAALTANKPLINDLGAITIDISDRIDMMGDDFRARFNGLILRPTVTNKAGVRFGGASQDIDGLTVWNQTNPTSSHTDANGFEFTNCHFSRFTNLVGINCARGFYMPQAAPTIGDPASNTVFSCVFENLRFNGWAISAVDFRTWLAGSASSTGNSWTNVYCHNNYFGSADVCSTSPWVMRAHDESVFSQINIEWCLPPGDVMFLQECRNMLFHSLHFEGITLTGNAAFVRPYFDCRVTIQTMSIMTAIIANNSGQKSAFRGYSIGGNPMSLDVTSLRVRNTTNAGARPFGLIEIEAGSTDGDCDFRKIDLGGFTGAVVVDPTGVIPQQVNKYNNVRVRNISAPNVAVDKVRTTNASGVVSSTTLVTDGTLQFAYEIGTYIIDGVLFYTVPAASDFKFRFNGTGTATLRASAQRISGAATTSGTTDGIFTTIPINVDQVAGGVDTLIDCAVHFTGTLIVTAAGTLTVQYAQNTSGATALTVLAHSRLSYRKIS